MIYLYYTYFDIFILYIRLARVTILVLFTKYEVVCLLKENAPQGVNIYINQTNMLNQITLFRTSEHFRIQFFPENLHHWEDVGKHKQLKLFCNPLKKKQMAIRTHHIAIHIQKLTQYSLQHIYKIGITRAYAWPLLSSLRGQIRIKTFPVWHSYATSIHSVPNIH